MPVLSARQKKLKPTGVDGPTLRELALLKHIADGLSFREIARRWNVTIKNVRSIAQRIRSHTGMDDLEEISRLAQGRIRALMPHLPLEGRVCSLDGRPRQRVSKALLEILRPLADGASNREIAEMTGLSITTVAGRRSRLMEIFEARTRYQLVERAKAMGLI